MNPLRNWRDIASVIDDVLSGGGRSALSSPFGDSVVLLVETHPDSRGARFAKLTPIRLSFGHSARKPRRRRDGGFRSTNRDVFSPPLAAPGANEARKVSGAGETISFSNRRGSRTFRLVSNEEEIFSGREILKSNESFRADNDVDSTLSQVDRARGFLEKGLQASFDKNAPTEDQELSAWASPCAADKLSQLSFL